MMGTIDAMKQKRVQLEKQLAQAEKIVSDLEDDIERCNVELMKAALLQMMPNENGRYIGTDYQRGVVAGKRKERTRDEMVEAMIFYADYVDATFGESEVFEDRIVFGVGRDDAVTVTFEEVK